MIYLSKAMLRVSDQIVFVEVSDNFVSENWFHNFRQLTRKTDWSVIFWGASVSFLKSWSISIHFVAVHFFAVKNRQKNHYKHLYGAWGTESSKLTSYDQRPTNHDTHCCLNIRTIVTRSQSVCECGCECISEYTRWNLVEIRSVTSLIF